MPFVHEYTVLHKPRQTQLANLFWLSPSISLFSGMCRALAWQHLLNAILHMCMHRLMMLWLTMESPNQPLVAGTDVIFIHSAPPLRPGGMPSQQHFLQV